MSSIREGERRDAKGGGASLEPTDLVVAQLADSLSLAGVREQARLDDGLWRAKVLLEAAPAASSAPEASPAAISPSPASKASSSTASASHGRPHDATARPVEHSERVHSPNQENQEAPLLGAWVALRVLPLADIARLMDCGGRTLCLCVPTPGFTLECFQSPRATTH